MTISHVHSLTSALDSLTTDTYKVPYVFVDFFMHSSYQISAIKGMYSAIMTVLMHSCGA